MFVKKKLKKIMFVVNFSFKIQYFYLKYDIHNQPGWVEIIEGQILQAVWELEGKCSETKI